MPKQLSAGVARTDITPPHGIAHAGWGAQTHQRAAGVDLPLWATALALSDGDQTVVIVDIDLIYLWEPEVHAVQKSVVELTGLPASNIRLAYTHTHSGPVNGSSWTSWIKEGTEMVPSYDSSLPHRIAGVAWAALQNLQPAQAAAGDGNCNIAVNRRFQRPEDSAMIVGRNWEGPVDHEVKVVRIDTLDGQPLAAIVNYRLPSHHRWPGCPTGHARLSGRGQARRRASHWGHLPLFARRHGQHRAGAGVAPGMVWRPIKRLGQILGHEASKVWWEIEVPSRQERYVRTLESGAPLAIYADDPMEASNTPLRVGTQPMHLPLKDLPAPEKLEAELAAHVTRLDQLRASGGSEEEIIQETMSAKRAKMRADIAHQLHGQTHRIFEAQVFALGDDIALFGMPGEPFVEIGQQVKQNSPFKHTLFSGYSNVGWAYIPMPDAYPLGGYRS